MKRYNSLILGLLFCIGTFISILSFAEVNFPWFGPASNHWRPSASSQTSESNTKNKWELDTAKEYTLVPLRDKDPTIRFYTFTITEGHSYINGVRRKQTLINGKFPGPVIQAIEGDQVVIELINDSNRPSSMHLHGLSMRGTNFMDGMVGLTQCPIQPGHSFRYTFIAQDVGSYWYHNHFQADEILGLYGPVLIHGRNEKLDYDEDMIVVVSSLYSQDPEALLEEYFEPYLGGTEPEPDQTLLQGKPHTVLEMSSGKRYRFHLINMCSYLGFWFSIENHLLNITAVDGFEVQPRLVDQIPIAAAQRYTFYVHMDNQGILKGTNTSTINIKIDKRGTPNLKIEEATGILNHGIVSSESVDMPVSENVSPQDFNKFDLEFSPLEFVSVPLSHTDYIALVATMQEDEYGVMTPGFNGTSRTMGEIPVLATILDRAQQEHHRHGMPKPLNEVTLELGSVLEMVILNRDDASHPFHLHGHKFWVIERQGIKASTPIKRDTVWVDQDGWVRIRIQLDNAGVWGFHCHNIWHAVGGMQYVIIVEPQLIRNQKPPREWWGLCERDELPLIRLR